MVNITRQVIVYGWLLFWLYWLLAAAHAKRNALTGTTRSRTLRLIIFGLSLFLIRVSAAQTNSPIRQTIISGNRLVQMIGLFLFAAGLLLAVWARRHLGQNWGMPMSQKQQPELVTSGPYRLIRHPIYSGFLLALLGSALASSYFWFGLLLISAIYYIYSSTVEEKTLCREFPRLYPQYMKRTKRLIPFIL